MADEPSSKRPLAILAEEIDQELRDAGLEVIVEEDGDLNEFEASIPLGIPPKPKAD